MRFIEAKQILSPWTSGENWFGTNYNMNLYKGCCHGCIYCDSRSECYHVENFDEVRGKVNAVKLLEGELRNKRKKGIIGTGAMSDPYNPFEEKYELTRRSLEVINKYGYGVGLITKSDLVLRDLDIFLKIKEHSPAMANLTITTYDDELCKKIEPNVTISSKRFEAVRRLSENGIFSGILMYPILPFINDNEENVISIVKKAAESRASFVTSYFGVTLRQNQRAHFYMQLDKLFPGLKDKYIKAYGNSYQCFSLNSEHLKNIFKEECKKYNLIYKMSDIIEALKSKYEEKQISLF